MLCPIPSMAKANVIAGPEVKRAGELQHWGEQAQYLVWAVT